MPTWVSFIALVLLVLGAVSVDGSTETRQEDTTFSPGPMYVLWAINNQYGERTTSVELISYDLNTGESTASSSTENSTSSYYTIDTYNDLFYAVIQSGPSFSDSSSLMTFDISANTPSVKSTCQLAENLNNRQNMTQCIFAAEGQHYILVTSYSSNPTSQLYTIQLTTCETQLVLDALPAMYSTSKCNYLENNNELYYLSLLPFKDQLVILNLGSLEYNTVAFPPSSSSSSTSVSQIDPASGDLYVSFPFGDQDKSLWYLPYGGSAGQWVNLCSAAGACPSYSAWGFIGIDNRYNAATFNNECFDGYPPTSTNPNFQQAPILIGEDGYLQSFAYSVYLNCIVWKGTAPSSQTYGGFGVPSYKQPRN